MSTIRSYVPQVVRVISDEFSCGGRQNASVGMARRSVRLRNSFDRGGGWQACRARGADVKKNLRQSALT